MFNDEGQSLEVNEFNLFTLYLYIIHFLYFYHSFRLRLIANLLCESFSIGFYNRARFCGKIRIEGDNELNLFSLNGFCDDIQK